MIDLALASPERNYPLMTRVIMPYGTYRYVKAGEQIWVGDYLHVMHSNVPCRHHYGTVEKATEIDFDGFSMVGAETGDYFWMRGW